MDKQYDLVFYGKTMPGFPPVQARQVLLNLLDAKPGAEAELFSGQRVLIRRGLPRNKAAYYQMHFERFGFKMEIETGELPDFIGPDDATRILDLHLIHARLAALQQTEVKTATSPQKTGPGPVKKTAAHLWGRLVDKIRVHRQSHRFVIH